MPEREDHMPVIIDQHTIDIRLTWLALDKQKLVEQQPNASDEQMAEIEERLIEVRYRENECKDWLRILNQDPGWGELISVGGRKVPRMPKFKSREEMDSRLANWGTAQGHDEQFLKSAREARAREDAQEDAIFMDGIGPIAAEEHERDSEGA